MSIKKKELLDQLIKMEELGLIKDRGLITKVNGCPEEYLDAFFTTYRANVLAKSEKSENESDNKEDTK